MATYPLVAIGDIWISAALLTERFVCDVVACKGQCCVEGVSGAPLEAGEVEVLRREYDSFAPFMSVQGRQAVTTQGVAVTDGDGDMVTPLVRGAECAYAWFDGAGICGCAIERAFLEGKTTFRKPISCWLYPIRVQKLSTGWGLNYHEWDVCDAARRRGQREKVPVYRFLREAIVARFGEAFYRELAQVAERGLS